jgi:Domain of unknown function (DUF4384)
MNSQRALQFLQTCLTLIALLANGSAQAGKELRARDLFLSGSQSADPSRPVGAKSDKTVKGPSPLGLRYSIVKQIDGESIEVDPESVFRSGDRIRLNVQANDNGYLYIVLRGSSGRWSPLFPSKEILSGDNRVKKGGEYEIPLGSVWFAFDEQQGTEKLFIVLARQPEPDFEKLVQSLRRESPPQQAKSDGNQKADQNDEGSVQVVASLDDGTVGKVRGQVRSRDLVFQKVDETTPGGKKEQAVYIVNRTGSTDSRVVVDVFLNHQ